MLFYVRGTLADTPNLPADRVLGMIASTWESLRQLEENGKVIAGGSLVGRSSGVVIVDVDTNEELSELVNRLPISAYLEWDIVPMVSSESALNSAKWALQQLKR